MKKLTRLTFAAVIGLTLPLGAALSDVQEMADKCEKCHGKDGNSEDGEVPNIAGMSAYYLSETLKSYVAGDRKGVKYTPEGGEESDMEEVASKLSEEDIEAISEHYAGKTFKVHVQEVDAAMADEGREIFNKEKCKKCHDEGGSVADDDAGILMGQWKPYMQKQFKLFDNGTRAFTEKKMRKRFEKLSDEDKAKIIEYLASGKI